jgi:hypothetical protein
LNLVQLKTKFFSVVTRQTETKLTKSEFQILIYGYHKEYQYPDPGDLLKGARIEWFFSTSWDDASTSWDDASTACDDASTACDDASTACDDAFPLLAVILTAQRYLNILSTIIALPSHYLQDLYAFIRKLPRSHSVKACLESASRNKPEGTTPPTTK